RARWQSSQSSALWIDSDALAQQIPQPFPFAGKYRFQIGADLLRHFDSRPKISLRGQQFDLPGVVVARHADMVERRVVGFARMCKSSLLRHDQELTPRKDGRPSLDDGRKLAKRPRAFEKGEQLLARNGSDSALARIDFAFGKVAFGMRPMPDYRI